MNQQTTLVFNDLKFSVRLYYTQTVYQNDRLGTLDSHCFQPVGW